MEIGANLTNEMLKNSQTIQNSRKNKRTRAKIRKLAKVTDPTRGEMRESNPSETLFILAQCK